MLCNQDVPKRIVVRCWQKIRVSVTVDRVDRKPSDFVGQLQRTFPARSAWNRSRHKLPSILTVSVGVCRVNSLAFFSCIEG